MALEQKHYFSIRHCRAQAIKCLATFCCSINYAITVSSTEFKSLQQMNDLKWIKGIAKPSLLQLCRLVLKENRVGGVHSPGVVADLEVVLAYTAVATSAWRFLHRVSVVFASSSFPC